MKPFTMSPTNRLPEASKVMPIGPIEPLFTKPVAKLVAAKPNAVVKAIANSTLIAAQINSETANHTALFLVILSTPVLNLEERIARRCPGCTWGRGSCALGDNAGNPAEFLHSHRTPPAQNLDR